MPADHLDEITDTMIARKLARCVYATCEWTGHMPTDAERYNRDASTRLFDVTVAEVRGLLERHDIGGDSAEDEIDMAVAIAAEPDGLPDNACVLVTYSREEPSK